MRKLLRIRTCAILMALIVAMSAFTGCQSGSGDATSSSTTTTEASATSTGDGKLEPVTLEWYSFMNDQKDTDMVWQKALNPYIEEKINAKINYHFFQWDDYATKMSTMVGSGQPMDILAAVWYKYTFPNVAQQGVLAPIEDLLETYAPNTYKLVPEALWKGVTVDNHILGIPAYKDSCQLPSFVWNKTFADKLGVDPSKVEWGSLYDLLPTLYEASAKKDQLFPEEKNIPIMDWDTTLNYYSPYETINGLAVANIPGIEAYAGKGTGETIFNVYDTEEFRKYAMTKKEMVEKNVYSYDGNQFAGADTVRAEGKLFGYATMGLVSTDPKEFGPDSDMKLSNSKYVFTETSSPQASVQCISATSKNKERALMFLDLVNTDSFVATTLRFGIEGEHYKKTSDGLISFEGTPRNGDPANRGYFHWYGWYFGSLFSSAIPEGNPADLWDRLKSFNEKAIISDNMGFIFDTKPVTNEIAACTTVIDEYLPNLNAGKLKDVNANIDEFVAKLKASGSEKIVEEAQKQLNTWRASVGKTVK